MFPSGTFVLFKPEQSQIGLFLETLSARKQTKGGHINQSGEAMSRATSSSFIT